MLGEIRASQREQASLQGQQGHGRRGPAHHPGSQDLRERLLQGQFIQTSHKFQFIITIYFIIMSKTVHAYVYNVHVRVHCILDMQKFSKILTKNEHFSY